MGTPGRKKTLPYWKKGVHYHNNCLRVLGLYICAFNYTSAFVFKYLLRHLQKNIAGIALSVHFPKSIKNHQYKSEIDILFLNKIYLVLVF